MVNGIGGSGGAAGRAAIEAALKQMKARADELSPGPAAEPSKGPSFTAALRGGVADVDREVRAADDLHLRAMKGEVDFHEVTAQLKKSELAFDFAMQVRNKFVEAYREVMRMNV